MSESPRRPKGKQSARQARRQAQGQAKSQAKPLQNQSRLNTVYRSGPPTIQPAGQKPTARQPSQGPSLSLPQPQVKAARPAEATASARLAELIDERERLRERTPARRWQDHDWEARWAVTLTEARQRTPTLARRAEELRRLAERRSWAGFPPSMWIGSMLLYLIISMNALLQLIQGRLPVIAILAQWLLPGLCLALVFWLYRRTLQRQWEMLARTLHGR